MPAAAPPDIALAVRYRPLAGLRGYPQNARRHTVSQIGALKRSLQEFGWTTPMLVADDTLIAGHGRHQAASELAAAGETIPGVADPAIGPTIDLSHLPPDKRRAYVIADNRLSDLAGWDLETLRSEVLALSEEGFDTTLLGYTPPELAALVIGWQTDFPNIERIAAEATDQLGVIIVRCTREQVAEIEPLLRVAAAGYPNVTFSAH